MLFVSTAPPSARLPSPATLACQQNTCCICVLNMLYVYFHVCVCWFCVGRCMITICNPLAVPTVFLGPWFARSAGAASMSAVTADMRHPWSTRWRCIALRPRPHRRYHPRHTSRLIPVPSTTNINGPIHDTRIDFRIALVIGAGPLITKTNHVNIFQLVNFGLGSPA